jgi:hypothetical protein
VRRAARHEVLSRLRGDCVDTRCMFLIAHLARLIGFAVGRWLAAAFFHSRTGMYPHGRSIQCWRRSRNIWAIGAYTATGLRDCCIRRTGGGRRPTPRAAVEGVDAYRVRLADPEVRSRHYIRHCHQLNSVDTLVQ